MLFAEYTLDGADAFLHDSLGLGERRRSAAAHAHMDLRRRALDHDDVLHLGGVLRMGNAKTVWPFFELLTSFAEVVWCHRGNEIVLRVKISTRASLIAFAVFASSITATICPFEKGGGGVWKKLGIARRVPPTDTSPAARPTIVWNPDSDTFHRNCPKSFVVQVQLCQPFTELVSPSVVIELPAVGSNPLGRESSCEAARHALAAALAALSAIGQIDDDTWHRSRLAAGVGRPVVVDIPGATVEQDEAAWSDGNPLTLHGRGLLPWRTPDVPDPTVAGWRIVPRRNIEPAGPGGNWPRGSRLLGNHDRTGRKA